MNFDTAFERLIGHEGGYVNHANDPGGETNHGVTARVARAHGYQGDMIDLPLETAKEIARAAYWDAVKADELPAQIRFDVFDAAYNSGVGQAAKWLQRAAGATADGQIGPMTIAAASAMDAGILLARFNGHRLQFLTDLPTWASFGKGWARRIANNLKEA
jgi:lysozyme family protein